MRLLTRISSSVMCHTPPNNPDNNFPICKGFIFYNNIHPTTYTHKVIADKFEKYLDSKNNPI
jgi:phospholipase/lecithinase/hemolysin